MAGLDNYLATLKDNAGMAGGYQQGLRDRAGLDTTLASLAQKQAETHRYTGETPSYLRGQEALARQKELANLQPEAEAGMGVPQAKAGLSLKNTQIEAEKANEVWKNLPFEHKMKMLDQTEQEATKVFGVMRQYLHMYPTADQAIAAFKQSHPQYTQDPDFDAQASKYKGMSSSKAIAELDLQTARIAFGISRSKAETQTEYGKIDLQGQNQRDLARIQGQYGLQEAQTRAAGSGTGKQNSAEILLDLSTRYVQALQSGDTTTADQLLWQINAVKNTKPDEPSFAGLPGKPGTQVKPLGKSSSGVINLDEPQPQKVVPQTRPQPTAKKPPESKFKPLTDVSSAVDKAIKARDAAIEKEKADRKSREEEEALQRDLKRLEERQKAGEFSSTTTNKPYSGGRHNIN